MRARGPCPLPEEESARRRRTLPVSQGHLGSLWETPPCILGPAPPTCESPVSAFNHTHLGPGSDLPESLRGKVTTGAPAEGRHRP